MCTEMSYTYRNVHPLLECARDELKRSTVSAAAASSSRENESYPIRSADLPFSPPAPQPVSRRWTDSTGNPPDATFRRSFAVASIQRRTAISRIEATHRAVRLSCKALGFLLASTTVRPASHVLRVDVTPVKSSASASFRPHDVQTGDERGLRWIGEDVRGKSLFPYFAFFFSLPLLDGIEFLRT